MIDGKRNKKAYLFAFLTFHTQSTDSLRSYLLFFFKLQMESFIIYNILIYIWVANGYIDMFLQHANF